MRFLWKRGEACRRHNPDVKVVKYSERAEQRVVAKRRPLRQKVCPSLNEQDRAREDDQEQEATIVQLKQDLQSKFAEQQKQIKALTSGLEKVNNQLELNKPAPRTVSNNQ